MITGEVFLKLAHVFAIARYALPRTAVEGKVPEQFKMCPNAWHWRETKLSSCRFLARVEVFPEINRASTQFRAVRLSSATVLHSLFHDRVIQFRSVMTLIPQLPSGAGQ